MDHAHWEWNSKSLVFRGRIPVEHIEMLSYQLQRNPFRIQTIRFSLGLEVVQRVAGKPFALGRRHSPKPKTPNWSKFK